MTKEGQILTKQNSTIKVKSITPYFAKKRAILKAIDFFIKNHKEFFVNVRITYNNEKSLQKVKTEHLTIRRELISAYLGFDFVKSARIYKSKKSLQFQHKDEIMELWQKLKS